MKLSKKESISLPIVALVVLAAIYLAWQLIGLRFTNHDDIYFHLYSIIYSEDYLGFSRILADRQARLQAYLNIPMVLWVHSLSNSILFDIINIGAFALLYLGLIYALSQLATLRNSLIIILVTLVLFPLHYYFTFPQGYPLMATWQPSLAFFSAGLLGSYLERGKAWILALSAMLFTCSLWGHEYNAVLFPIFLVLVFLAKEKVNFKKLLKIAWPFMFGWMASVGIYLLFSILQRKSGADAIGRVSFGFDFISWFKTFFILQQKAFLPSALLRGVELNSATAQGVPEVPALITFSNLWYGTDDMFSIAIVFVLALIVFALSFSWQTLSNRSIRLYSVLFASITIIPCLVISASSHYQMIVTKGWLQGHMTSFYSQLGLSALCFLFLSFIYNCCVKKLLKMFFLLLSTMLLASFATTTFIYNNLNRQLMSANRQKWMAVHELASFVQSDRPDLMEKVFYAPALWTTTGVSSIPLDNLLQSENYWTQYSKHLLNIPLKMTTSSNEQVTDQLVVSYISTPVGTPIVILHEKVGSNDGWRITLLSSQAITGSIVYRGDAERITRILSDSWQCSSHCTIIWHINATFQPSSLSFKPDYQGPSSLLAQFISSRNGAYSQPLKRSPSD